MKFSTIAKSSFVALASSALAMPRSRDEAIKFLEKRQVDSTAAQNAYNGHCSDRKAQLVAMGADALDVAVAMMETGINLTGHDYPLGDNKVSDAANFGIFKNNWWMMHTYCSQFKGQPAENWMNGQCLNYDDAAAIKCQHEQRAALGDWEWFKGQRYGISGVVYGADASDVDDYRQAVLAIKSFVDDGHLTDDMETWYPISAI